MLSSDAYLQRSQGKQESEAKRRNEGREKSRERGKETVGNSSSGHDGGAEAAGWQVGDIQGAGE